MLDEKGKYEASLRLVESRLLRMLQNKIKGDLSLTVPISKEQIPSQDQYLSFLAHNVQTDIKTAYRKGKFAFDIRTEMYIVLSERLFPFDPYQLKGKKWLNI